MRLDSVGDLRSVYRQPARGAIDKVIHQLDTHCRDFIAKAPFFLLSTADGHGTCDGSPKGGPPGFVRVLDDRHLAWADFAGNNRLDSFQNLVGNDSVALLFLIPGLDETLRVNGTAALVTDPELCVELAIEGKPARVVVAVTVGEVYIHCAKALRRVALVVTRVLAQPGGPALGRVHRQGPRRHRSRSRHHRTSPRARPRGHSLGAGRGGQSGLTHPSVGSAHSML